MMLSFYTRDDHTLDEELLGNKEDDQAGQHRDGGSRHHVGDLLGI